MKKQVSITVEESLLVTVGKLIKEGSFRNKSHLFEYALKKYLELNKEN